jgi:hypothetical protein
MPLASLTTGGVHAILALNELDESVDPFILSSYPDCIYTSIRLYFLFQQDRYCIFY